MHVSGEHVCGNKVQASQTLANILQIVVRKVDARVDVLSCERQENDLNYVLELKIYRGFYHTLLLVEASMRRDKGSCCYANSSETFQQLSCSLQSSTFSHQA